MRRCQSGSRVLLPSQVPVHLPPPHFSSGHSAGDTGLLIKRLINTRFELPKISRSERAPLFEVFAVEMGREIGTKETRLTPVTRGCLSFLPPHGPKITS